MQHIDRPSPFVLVSTNHGSMIVNRNDIHTPAGYKPYGVGYQLLNHASFDVDEVDLLIRMLDVHRKHFGDGVVAIDCGANAGVYTIDFAHAMYGWGHVYAFEAQEKIYYSLAGNVILNNCLNVTARFAAVGSEVGTITIPEPNYLVPASYGSFELKQRANTENIGQPIDYSNAKSVVPMITIDSLALPRLDLMKIDVEGMEEDVLKGAAETIQRCKPALMIEIIKSDQKKMCDQLSEYGYKLFPAGMNLFAIHESDPVLALLKVLDEAA